jgi:hypothetical protein
MNIRVTLQGLRPARPAQPAHAHKTKFNPRAGILDEVVAGLLWITLDLPPDVSRCELETFAHQLVTQIKFGASESKIETDIASLQSMQLGRPVNHEAVRGLAERVMNAVRGF